MAEFLNHEPVPVDDFGAGNGFDAMGKPIPSHRRQAAYDQCKIIGLHSTDANVLVGRMSEDLERDRPYDAVGEGMRSLDLVGTYRVMAYLLAAPAPAEQG
ncbi:MAG: hypothetical protein VX464_20835 [Pseudomonadota bacterium]|nr:hypothetical protein [Pseudomonadota bacterium]